MKLSHDTRVLITGCGGMLGEAMHATFKEHCDVRATDIDLNEPWLSLLDVRDRDAVKAAVQEFKPHLILHLAAHTDMEWCEQNAEEAYRTNAYGTENVVAAAMADDIPTVYIGTAGVFDGVHSPYVDYDAPHPLSVYAKSKFAGETAVRGHLRKYWICRAGWMMGGGPKKDKKFIGKILRQVNAGKTELSVVDDKSGSPTYTYDFAASLLRLVQTDAYGTFHMAGQGGDCSRYDVAAEMLKRLGLEKKIALKRVTSDHFAKEYFAPRPDSEVLIDLRLRLLGISSMRDWHQSLADYLSRHEWLTA